MPPSRPEATFATPWAINSWLESCRSSIMPSATTAHSNDSIAASMAMVKAGRNRFGSSTQLMCGRVSGGNVWGMPPNCVPMVATPKRVSRCPNTTATVPSAIATMLPGRYRCHRAGQPRIRASERPDNTRLAGLMPATCRPRKISFSTNSGGSFSPAPRAMPVRSRNWELRMITAMPAVNPAVTG
jgi:hypothetical protein